MAWPSCYQSMAFQGFWGSYKSVKPKQHRITGVALARDHKVRETGAKIYPEQLGVSTLLKCYTLSHGIFESISLYKSIFLSGPISGHGGAEREDLLDFTFTRPHIHTCGSISKWGFTATHRYPKRIDQVVYHSTRTLKIYHKVYNFDISSFF